MMLSDSSGTSESESESESDPEDIHFELILDEYFKNIEDGEVGWEEERLVRKGCG